MSAFGDDSREAFVPCSSVAVTRTLVTSRRLLKFADAGAPAHTRASVSDSSGVPYFLWYVAWSPTTLNFMQSGNLLDPRRGRGFYNTYPARWPGLRYPLDYIFSTKHFSIGTMRVLPAFGSDHLPLVAELFAE